MTLGRNRWNLAKVAGDSMLPTLRSGQWLLVDSRRAARVGDVVVARDPRTDLPIVKRLTQIENGFWLEGDAHDPASAATSSDSWVFGAVAGLDGVVVVGLQKGGTWVADRLAEVIASIEPGRQVPVGAVDPTFHRDDIGLRPVTPGAASHIPFPLDGAVVVLVDDVLFTGRTVRAAIEALNDYGRPRSVQLAVVVDRGHRELPIRPDYVGKNLPTSREEKVAVTPDAVLISAAGGE